MSFTVFFFLLNPSIAGSTEFGVALDICGQKSSSDCLGTDALEKGGGNVH